jgi:hypothetical protein
MVREVVIAVLDSLIESLAPAVAWACLAEEGSVLGSRRSCIG